MIRIFTALVISMSVQYVSGQFQIEDSQTKCGTKECVVISKCPSVLRLVFQVSQQKYNFFKQNNKHQNYSVSAPMHAVTKA